MSSVFPIRSPVETEDREPRLVDLDDETADEVFDCLAAATTRRILAALHDEPRTVSDLAAITDTSVQNAGYHVRKLEEAGLVEPVDTWYSERGTEMTVYAPADGSLVLVAGGAGDGLYDRLKRALGALGLVGALSVLVAVLTDRLGAWFGGAADASAEVAAEAAGEGAALGGLDPALVAGIACLVGGLAVLVALAVVRRRRGRPGGYRHDRSGSDG